MFYGASPNIFEKAKTLRDSMTDAEILLWEKLSNKKLNGFRFRRQHPLGNFIADFYCHKAKLVIELDGEIHQEAEQADYDLGRTYEIEGFVIRVIRFKNKEVSEDIDAVLMQISRFLT